MESVEHDFDGEPPEGCHHYVDLAEVPSPLQKYYHQRYSIFSAYDDGIWMTEDAWFGVTPEPVANKIAQHVSKAIDTQDKVLIDCFAGVGGNVIAFASSQQWKRVYAIEKDPKNLKCAIHNARVYGVDQYISWYQGDCFELLKNELSDLAPHSIIFASPPWGGPGYTSDAVFDLSTMQPYNLPYLHTKLSDYSQNLIFYLPRTSDMRQVARYSDSNKPVLVMHYCLEGASKALCVYYGDFSLKEQDEGFAPQAGLVDNGAE